MSAYNWFYPTTAQQVGGKVQVMQQGKVVGGSSSINGMCWTRGTVEEYNAIEALGNPGWNYANITSYIKKAERFHLPNAQQTLLGATDLPSAHGYIGKVDTGFPQPYEATALLQKYIAAVKSVIPGIAQSIDPSSGRPNGVGPFQYSIKPGNSGVIEPLNNLRSNAATAYIYPYMNIKPNLTILTGHVGASIIWDLSETASAKAVGVNIIPTSDPLSTPPSAIPVSVSKEVIVAAGAIGSPHFLELSGIGDKDILSASGIQVKVELPSVGTNLQDQSQVNMIYIANPSANPADYSATNAPLSMVPAFLDYTQVLGVGAAEAATQLRASIPSRAASLVAAGGFTSQLGLEKILQLQAQDIVDHKAPVIEISLDAAQPPFIVGDLLSAFWPLLPQWRGTVHITSSNPTIPPVVNPNYLTDEFDLWLQGNASRIVREIFQSAPLSDLVSVELVPSLAVVQENASDAQWQDFVQGAYTPTYHPLGTVPMLPKADGGAVNSQLMVYGIDNVRVVDSSTMPIQISAHVGATVYGIAEKAADIIKMHSSVS